VAKSDLIDVVVIIKAETSKAYLVTDGAKEVWLPKSQIEVEKHKDSMTSTVTMPEWLAIEKRLV
jgi:hypothetical protein